MFWRELMTFVHTDHGPVGDGAISSREPMKETTIVVVTGTGAIPAALTLVRDTTACDGSMEGVCHRGTEDTELSTFALRTSTHPVSHRDAEKTRSNLRPSTFDIVRR